MPMQDHVLKGTPAQVLQSLLEVKWNCSPMTGI